MGGEGGGGGRRDLAGGAVSGSKGTASEKCIHTDSHRERAQSQDFSNAETDKRKILNVLNYSRPERGKRRQGEFISYQPWAKTNKILLTYLTVYQNQINFQAAISVLT